MLEVELKARLDADEAERTVCKLVELRFLAQETVDETDIYFNAPDRDFRATDEALRLRRVVSGGSEITRVTYKGKSGDVLLQSREEIEFIADDFESARRLLVRLGCTPAATVAKQRRYFCLSGHPAITACLDIVEGLGAYIELEALLPDGASDNEKEAARSQLLALLPFLGLTRRRIEPKTYLELVLGG